ncbi:MAG: eukaryotic-like serine/threonine-protein kinase [Gaiellaceae bacterium]|nr:eukaryotic-like serine/threonine-protein kinase [Gaiellaceae bacterium]
MDESRLPPRYRQPELIARGGMGEIFRAEDADLARTVVVKVLAEHLAGDAAIRARFTREALAAARLSNAPSTVTIYDVGEHGGRPYIVMEYLPGGSLADVVAREGAQPLGRTLEWLREAAAALDAAHASGIVHRDVKPANLLLDEEGRVHVADFGVASAAGLGSFTEAGTVVGTAGYLSPEQARGERATPASDRYALAVVAFELLTGTRPFERDTSTAEALAHVSAPIPPASQQNPELPAQVDDVLARALAKEPQYRFATAADFVHAVRDALDEAAGRTAVGALPPVARRGRRSIPLLLAGLGALLLAGVAAAVLFGGEERPAATSAVAPRTVAQTVTLPGTTATVVETVTTAAQTTPPEAEPGPTESPSRLNDQGFALMRAGDYAGALPLLEQAVAGLAGSGETAEAYATYNLAFTRRALGRCDGVLELLDRSEQVQGERKEISRLRREAERSCENGDE